MRSLFTVGLIVAVTKFAVPNSASGEQVIEPNPHHKTIRHAGSKYYPPLEWLDQHGKSRGFITDLRKAMAATDGSAVSFQLTSW